MIPQDVEFEGVPIRLGRTSTGQPRILVMPPLSFKSLKKFRKELSDFDDTQLSDEAIDLVEQLAGAALKRNYPDMDYTFLEEVLDAGNMMHIMQVVMDVSGLKRKEYEDSVKGEPTGNPSTGVNSTVS